MKKTFIDRARIKVEAGKGGNGCISFRREKFVPRGGPDGGGGGKGGSVFLQVSSSVPTLIDFYFRPFWRASSGASGQGKKKQGKSAADLVISVPRGTVVRSEATGQVVGDLLEDGERLILARGGRGGKGNASFATSTRQAPRIAQKGQEGEKGSYFLELKLIADIGLVGYPNAGKSTLISRISRAHPRIAAYPFTTLRPVLGMVIREFSTPLVVADIPGLIEGAHQNIGLGHDFLRHIERTRALLLVLDMAGTDGRTPLQDYRSLRRELKLYKEELVRKPFLVVANKMDLPEAPDNLSSFLKSSRLSPRRVFSISAKTGEGLEELKDALFSLPGGREKSVQHSRS